MTYIPKKENRTAAVFTTVMLACALVCFIAYSSGVIYRAIYGIAGVVCVTFGIQFWRRFMITDFEYVIDPADSLHLQNNITVIQTVGKKRTTVCNLSLQTALGIVPCEKGVDPQKEFGKISRSVNFCRDMFPRESYVLVMDFNGSLLSIKLQCSKEFADEIKARIPQ